MGFDLLNHWGFNYYTTITWDKKTGPCPFGPYQITTEMNYKILTNHLDTLDLQD